MLTLTKNELPESLRQLAVPPRRIHYQGDLPALLAKPRLAVVGSRKASPYGRGVTDKFVTELVNAGVVIVSGLAFGIDTIAHLGCLKAGGQTIAVLPSDLHDIYPSAHTNLAKDIVRQGGALITEYEPGTIPFQSNFIARNRIIAGLADGVLITEAALKSGSLHTANFALEQGKTVLAVPGNITSPLSEGCNNLIKSGAVPVTKPEDIFAAMRWERHHEQRELFASNKEENCILKLLAGGISDGTELLSRSGLSVAVYNQTLTMLEITGRVRSLGANHWTVL